jgi:hypothetical protein
MLREFRSLGINVIHSVDSLMPCHGQIQRHIYRFWITLHKINFNNKESKQINMFKKILMVLVMACGLLFVPRDAVAQNSGTQHKWTISGNLKTDSLSLRADNIPMGITVEGTLSTPTTARFEFSIGNQPGRKWYRVAAASDTTNYTIKLADSTFIPLNPLTIGQLKGSESYTVWVRIITTDAETAGKVIDLYTKEEK